MKKLLLLLPMALLLAGCETMPKGLENRLACSVAKDELYVVSKYGAIGIASQIADVDRKEVCK